MKENCKTAVISLGVSRRDYPYLLNWLYLTSPGIHYLNAVLSAYGFETCIIDKVDKNLNLSEVIDKLHSFKPEIVLFNQFFTTRDDVKRVAESLPVDTIRGIGGQDATFHSMSLSNDQFRRYYDHVDFVWQGECETGFVEFLSDFTKGSGPTRINNLGNRVQDVDTLPVLKHDDYQGEAAFLVTSRGCFPKGCNFCTTPRFYHDGWKARSASHVIDELHAIKVSGRIHVNITDDNFLGNSEGDLERALTIIRKAGELGMKLYPMTSVRQILRAEKAGYLGEFTGTVPKIFLGVENNSPGALEKLGKKVNVSSHGEESARAIDALYRHGISPYLGFINFNPDTTLEELENSLIFLHENHRETSNFHYFFNKLGVFEGTDLYDNFKDKRLDIGIADREYHYDFKDRRTAVMYSILKFIIDQTQVLDCIHFESTHLIYMNQLQDTDIGKKYLNMKYIISDMNYDFIKNAMQICMQKDSLEIILDLVEEHKKNIKVAIENYKILLPEIIGNSIYILKEPLMYII